MESQPLVSIGVPTFNRLEKLKKTVQCLIEQPYRNIEIIISDNCTPGNSVQAYFEILQNIDSRIKTHLQDKNIEIEPNFNFVYRQAKGKYFMWVADDDEFDSNYISTCVSFLEANKDYVLCSGISEYYSNKKFLFSEKILDLNNDKGILRMFKYFIYVFKNGIFYGVYRNDLKFQNPIQKHIGGDWNHIARTSLLGKIKVLNTAKVKRSDDGGSSSRNKITSRWGVKGLKKLFFETFTAYQIVFFLFNEPIVKERFSLISIRIIQLGVFVLLNFKFLIHSIKIRIK